jgi:hypothetical protein
MSRLVLYAELVVMEAPTSTAASTLMVKRCSTKTANVEAVLNIG